jgi:hypothetical protein
VKVRQFVNTDLALYEDMCFVYSIIMVMYNRNIIGTDFNQLGLVALMSKAD